MLEMIRCSCNKPVAIYYEQFLLLKEIYGVNLALEILEINKKCCKIRFLTPAHFKDYLT
jgi:DNA-directed RNA polymerase subunit N (RpoN/RPB10)